MHSISKEDYLKAIYHLTNGKETLANTSKIAAYLNIKASSCTDMVKKLASDKLISYEPYRGVRLSPSGRKAAIYMIRKHRLWETFLVNTLGFNWDEVHNVAEQLEHTESPELITRLDAFLGHPTLDPHGDPIPDANGIVQNLEEKNLASIMSCDALYSSDYHIQKQRKSSEEVKQNYKNVCDKSKKIVILSVYLKRSVCFQKMFSNNTLLML